MSAIKLLYEGHSRAQVSEQVGCRYDTLTSWMDKYLDGGVSGPVSPIRHQKPSRLTKEQQQQLKDMVLPQRPTNYGYDRNMWTGAILSAVIEQRFEVQLKDSRIERLVWELGLSYQQAERDYANADPKAQKDWLGAVKKNCNCPSPVSAPDFLTSLPMPTVPVCSMVGQNAILASGVESARRVRNKLNRLLCVDAHSGEEYFRLSPQAKTEDVSQYLAQLCYCVELGYARLWIIVERNPTDKLKKLAQAVHLDRMGLAQSIRR